MTDDIDQRIGGGDLQVGDVVRLKSGGALMTMREPFMDRHGVLQAWCDWHNGTTPMGRMYPLSALVKYVPSEASPEPPPQVQTGFAVPESD
jgi:uncharacterized protein YodC (DUF2158 family)